ncbi:hypothetical protein H632_c1400p0, partial [Helicosporidium sp. ATCC 50920]
MHSFLTTLAADEMLKTKAHAALLESYEDRTRQTIAYLMAIRPSLKVTVGALVDPKAPTLAATDAAFDAIVVSEETVPGAQAINDHRALLGLEALAVIVVPVLSGRSQQDKLSSTELLVAIASRTEERARAYAGEVGLPSVRLHGSYASLLEDAEVDAVYIPLPTTLHVEWAVRAAAAGKHIVLEKPIAHTREDLATILSAATRAGVVLVDGTMWSHHPRERRMRELLEG